MVAKLGNFGLNNLQYCKWDKAVQISLPATPYTLVILKRLMPLCITLIAKYEVKRLKEKKEDLSGRYFK